MINATGYVLNCQERGGCDSVPDTVKDETTGRAFLTLAAAEYGEWHELEPAPLSWGRHDPMADFTNQYPGTPVISVAMPDGGDW